MKTHLNRSWVKVSLVALVVITFHVISSSAAEVLYSFSSGTNGMNPRASLIQRSDGILYGTTEEGGSHGYGSIFKVTTNGELMTLFSFNRTNGANPHGGLILGPEGNFYGTTFSGGANDLGTIFRFTTNGVLNMILSFGSTGSTAGWHPIARLLLGSDGNFYGTTWSGSASGYGTVFKFTVPPGANFGYLDTLTRFSGYTGAYSRGGLVQGPDGYFYGTTSSGGSGSSVGWNGTIFRVNTNGFFSSLFSFNRTNGAWPSAALTFGNDGNLYGTSAQGGSNGYGTIFRVTKNGLLTSLYSFNGTNGANPHGDLILASDNSFYGTTIQGGLTGNGTIFRVTTNGTFSTIFSFTGEAGAYPYGGLVLGHDGDLYGTTYNGFIFRVSTNGTLTYLVSFNDEDGAHPHASLVAGPDDKLYGTTKQGGNSGHGTIFTVNTNGSVEILTSFAGTNGANPQSGVTFGADGLMYGTTVFGSSQPKGNGVIYRADPSGSVTLLHDFNGTNGANPFGGLTWGPDGKLYGTTQLGGKFNLGTVFSAATNGLLASLFSFTIATGSYPYAGLTIGPDQLLHGVTWANSSAHFKISTIGMFTSTPLSPFLSNPYGPLVAGADGTSFYGTGERDGSSGRGTIFRITTNGNLTVIFRFNGSNGSIPRSPLTRAPDGNYYGTTSKGGGFDRGTAFRITTNGVLTSLLSFTGTNGAAPEASLTLADDGRFYGVTTRGGEFNAGVVYRIQARPRLISQPLSQTNQTGGTISLSATVDGIAPYTYQWFKDEVVLIEGSNTSGVTTNQLTLGSISPADSGAYTVVVSNAFGATTSFPAFLHVVEPPAILVNAPNFGFSPSGFGFSITSSIDSVLLIQSSTNLVNWIPLATLTNLAGTVHFIDQNTNHSRQFYRAIQQ